MVYREALNCIMCPLSEFQPHQGPALSSKCRLRSSCTQPVFAWFIFFLLLFCFPCCEGELEKSVEIIVSTVRLFISGTNTCLVWCFHKRTALSMSVLSVKWCCQGSNRLQLLHCSANIDVRTIWSPDTPRQQLVFRVLLSVCYQQSAVAFYRVFG